MRLAALALAALVAGCAGAPPAADPVDDPVPQAPAAPEGRLPIAGPHTNASAWQNVTEMHWASNATLGNLALAFELDLPDEECSVIVGVTGEADQSGTHAVRIYETEGFTGWGSGGGGSLATARAGPISSEDVLAGGGGYGSGSATRGASAGMMLVTLVADGTRPQEFTDMIGGQTVAVDVECDAPFSVRSAQAGYEAWVAGIAELEGGAAADAFLVGGAAVASSRTLEVTNGSGHARFGSFGDEAGQVVVSGPNGTQEAIIPTQTKAAVEGGPGTYTVSATRAGVRFEAFWAAAYGLSDEVDLGPGLREERVNTWFD